jgi:hypothetical protein
VGRRGSRGTASAAGGRRAMEGRSDRGMKTHEKDEAVRWWRAPLITRLVVRLGDPIY